MQKGSVSLKKVEEGKYSMDVRGYTCPYPEIFARRGMDTIAPGEIFELTTDNVQSCETIPTTAEELKYKVLEVKKINAQDWRILIQKQ